MYIMCIYLTVVHGKYLMGIYIYIYICYPPRTYVSEAATLLEGILPCCNDLSKEDGRCC